MKARHILFAFAAILLIGCSESDESISARVAKTRADEARVLFMQDIADLEMQIEKLVKENERLVRANKKQNEMLVQANKKQNERLVQVNKKLRQENMTLAKQLEDMKKSYLIRRDVIPKKKSVPKRVVAPTQWFQGGNLHSATVAQWENASYQNKLATAGDWLVTTKWKGHLNSPGDFDRLKLKAQLLVECVDETVVGLELGEMRVAEIAVALHHLSNDFSP